MLRIYKQTILTCTTNEQANSIHLTDNLLTPNFPVLQCKMVASLVQQILVSVLEPVNSKLNISFTADCSYQTGFL